MPPSQSPGSAGPRRWVRWLCIVGTLLGLLLVGMAGLQKLLESIGGRVYDPSDAEDAQVLRSFIEQVRPLQAEIELYRQSHRKLPNEDELKFPNMFRPGTTDSNLRGWHYVRDSDVHYRLYRVFGWDPALWYDSQDQSWWYDPGDGSDTTDIKTSP